LARRPKKSKKFPRANGFGLDSINLAPVRLRWIDRQDRDRGRGGYGN